MADINVPGLIGIIVFYLAILAVGLWAARKRKKDEEESILAGRSFGIVVGSFTMTATWVGGGYINGTAEAVYASGSGLAWTQAPWGYTTSLVIGGLFFAKIMRQRKYTTMLDPFQRKYGARFGSLLFIPALIGDVFWSASILAALGSTVSVVVGLDRFTSVIVSAAIAVAYTLVGGLYAVAYTDILQLICIFIGLWLSVPFVLSNPAVGNISDNKSVWIGEIQPHKAGLWLDYAFHLIFGGIPWQVYFQRVLACKNAKIAQGLSFTAAIGCVIFTIPSVLIGAAGAVTDWTKTSYYTGPANATNIRVKFDQSLILPMALQYLTPTAVSFIGLGAISAAVMSSSDSSVLSAATMFSHNVYKNAFRPKASSREMIWVLRASIILAGAIATAMALSVKSIYVLFVLCSDLVYVILFPQLLCVIYLEKIVNTYGAALGYIVGLTLRILGGEKGLGIPPTIIYPLYNEKDGQLFPYRTLSMVAGLITIILVSYLAKIGFERGKIPMKYDFLHCFDGKGQQYDKDNRPMSTSTEYEFHENPYMKTASQGLVMEPLPEKRAEVYMKENEGYRPNNGYTAPGRDRGNDYKHEGTREDEYRKERSDRDQRGPPRQSKRDESPYRDRDDRRYNRDRKDDRDRRDGRDTRADREKREDRDGRDTRADRAKRDDRDRRNGRDTLDGRETREDREKRDDHDKHDRHDGRNDRDRRDSNRNDVHRKPRRNGDAKQNDAPRRSKDNDRRETNDLARHQDPRSRAPRRCKDDGHPAREDDLRYKPDRDGQDRRNGKGRNKDRAKQGVSRNTDRGENGKGGDKENDDRHEQKWSKKKEDKEKLVDEHRVKTYL